MANSSENKDNAYSAKPPIFDGEKFEYRKDRMKSFLLGFDMDLWNLVVDGYEEPKDTEGKIIPRSKMTRRSSSSIITKLEPFFSTLSLTTNMRRSPTRKLQSPSMILSR